MGTERRYRAHPQSALGDFYVVDGDCISCGAPHTVAPDLIGWAVNSDYEHCIWKKQPETRAELEQAFAALDAACIGCHRYAGSDSAIISRIGSDYCDNAPLPSAELQYLPVAEPRLTLIEDSRGIAGRVLAALFCTAVSAFLIWLLATHL
jgi:hypothetical protein